jgi:hypothetical protein
MSEANRYAPDSDEARLARSEAVKKAEALALPELVELMEEMTGKRPELFGDPRIVASLRGYLQHNARGDFKIALGRFLMQNPTQAAATFAHEIGHLIDYLPDFTVQGRGNILGRIAKLKQYLKETLGETPYAGTELTEGDRNRLRKAAEREVKRGPEITVEEIIREIPIYQELGITPEDIIGFWNQSSETLKQKFPAVYDYIARASTETKKAIIKMAMQGVVDAVVKRMGATSNVQVGSYKVREMKVTVRDQQATKEEIAALFKQKLEEEIAKRHLFTLEQIDAELKAVTHEWRGPVDTNSPKEVQYRYSSPELWADGLSMLLNAPKRLQELAPNFTQALFNYMERHQPFADVYKMIQDRIHESPESVMERRSQRRRAGYQTGREKTKAVEEQREKDRMTTIKDELAIGLIDRNHPVLKHLRKLENGNDPVAAEHATKTRKALSELDWADSRIAALTYKLVDGPLKIAAKAGLSPDDMGEIVQALHVIHDRGEIWNPGGESPETMQELLDYKRSQWGEEKFNAALEAQRALREWAEDYVIPEFIGSGMAGNDLAEVMMARDYYANFNIVKYIDGKSQPGIGATIHRQVGTIEDVANPWISTMLKYLSMVRSAQINRAKLSMLQDLAKVNEVKNPDTFFVKVGGKYPANIPKDPPPGRGYLTVMKGGKVYRYEVDKSISDMFTYHPEKASGIARVVRAISQPFRELFVSKNPLWMAANPIRDFQATVVNNPLVRLRDVPGLANAYRKAIKDVWKAVMQGEWSDDYFDLMHSYGLPSNRIWTGWDVGTETEIDKLVKDAVLDGKANREAAEAMTRLGRFFQVIKDPRQGFGIVPIWNFLDKLGKATDVWGKYAGARFLMQNKGVPLKDAANDARENIGTPNYRAQGSWQQVTNNAFMFSNVGKEGWRRSWRQFNKDRFTYLWKFAVMYGIPTLATAYAASKFGENFGPLNRALRRIPKHDRAASIVIPLNIRDDGKAVYIRIPVDYNAQVVMQMLHDLATLDIQRAARALQQGQPYRPHPLYEVAKTWANYYIDNQNTLDSFTGQPVLSDDAMAAGGIPAAKTLARYTWNELGGKPWKNMKSGIEPERDIYEEFLNTMPGSILGRFVKISDQGLREEIEASLREAKSDTARVRIARNAALAKLINGEKLDDQEQLDLAIGVAISDPSDKIYNDILKRYPQKATYLLSALRRASNDMERAKLIMELEKKNLLAE